ncbi:hypothetical protein KIL84_006410 [Mauremys mutica]|uniref:C2H2-type domain-containing protein n=1 Tax=Mauremys mutica TaxID=74926 RepID=A0A9D3X132_9SAUR|nr:hypothetical protein KIL84_006410 [Mauremys mutica]
MASPIGDVPGKAQEGGLTSVSLTGPKTEEEEVAKMACLRGDVVVEATRGHAVSMLTPNIDIPGKGQWGRSASVSPTVPKVEEEEETVKMGPFNGEVAMKAQGGRSPWMTMAKMIPPNLDVSGVGQPGRVASDSLPVPKTEEEAEDTSMLPPKGSVYAMAQGGHLTWMTMAKMVPCSQDVDMKTQAEHLTLMPLAIPMAEEEDEDHKMVPPNGDVDMTTQEGHATWMIVAKMEPFNGDVDVKAQGEPLTRMPFPISKAEEDDATKPRHQETHRGAELHRCTDCGRAFRHARRLAQHRRACHAPGEPHSCAVCGQTFAARSQLARHRRGHTDERPYRCGVCGKAYSISSHLLVHLRGHTEERPYRCADRPLSAHLRGLLARPPQLPPSLGLELGGFAGPGVGGQDYNSHNALLQKRALRFLRHACPSRASPAQPPRPLEPEERAFRFAVRKRHRHPLLHRHPERRGEPLRPGPRRHLQSRGGHRRRRSRRRPGPLLRQQLLPGVHLLVPDTQCSVPEAPDVRKPVTAQERQREREEKRKRRQERAKEREKKQKEKERKELRRGDVLGGLVLSENDRSLLERWTKMIDRNHQKPAHNGPTDHVPAVPAGHVPPGATGQLPAAPGGHVPSGATGHLPAAPAGHVPSGATGHLPTTPAGHVPSGATGHLPTTPAGHVTLGAAGQLPATPAGHLRPGATGQLPATPAGHHQPGAAGNLPATSAGHLQPGATGHLPATPAGHLQPGAAGHLPATPAGHLQPGAAGHLPATPAGHVPLGAVGHLPATSFPEKAPAGGGPKLTVLPIVADPAHGSVPNMVQYFPAPPGPFPPVLVAPTPCHKASAKPECLLSVKYAPGQIFQTPFGLAGISAWPGVQCPENWAVAGRPAPGEVPTTPSGAPPQDGPSVRAVGSLVTPGREGVGLDPAVFLQEMGKRAPDPAVGGVKGPGQHPIATTASPETAPTTESPDITMVTHQLSKSQVEDLLPPVFSVTPKGSGAGYGVGFDLEEFLNQSFDMVGENRDSQGDSAPLSASLLADWLEVHRMNPADMESLQQELQLGSPMILSDIPDLQDA